MSLMTNINPIPWSVVVLAASVAGGIWLYQAGSSACDNRWKAQHAESLTRAIEQANEQAVIDVGIVAAHTRAQAKADARARIITKTVIKHVKSHPVYVDCSLDPVGLCLARSAASGTTGEECTAQPDAGVPAAGSTRERDDGRAVGKLYRDRQPTQYMPHAAQGTDGVGIQ